MPGLTFNTYLSTLADMLVVPVTDAPFLNVLPSIIADASLRIYRDLDLIDTSVTDSSSAVSTGTRFFDLPSSISTFVVVSDINIITPAGTVDPNAGSRQALWPVSMAVLNMMFPSATGSGVPQYFAMVDQDRIALGPFPDAAYQAEVTGTIRPNDLSSTVTTTLLSVYFPDLFLAASMVFGAGYQKNFGAAADDPKAGMSWESHYQALLASASVEEQRKRFTAAGWSSESPAPLATPPRT